MDLEKIYHRSTCNPSSCPACWARAEAALVGMDETRWEDPRDTIGGAE